MKYTKINPFDFYLLAEKNLGTVDVTKMLRDSVTVGEVTISISGGTEPYSFKQGLIKFDGILYLRTSTVPPSDEALAKFETPEVVARLRELQAAGPQCTVTYDPESEDDTGEKTEFVQKLGMNEYPYDRVIRCSYPVSAIYQLREAQELFGDAVKLAQGGAKILWECFPENEISWRDLFVEAPCATWTTGRGGVEVGPLDPSL